MVRWPYAIYSMTPVDVRIGVTYSPREIDMQLAEDTDIDDLRSQISDTLGSDGSVLWLTDRRGRVVGVPAKRVAYVEIDSASEGRSIGFGS